MPFFSLIRIILAGAVLVFTVIVLGTSANYLATLNSYKAPIAPWSAYDVAISVITFVVVGPFLAIDLLRAGAFTSMVVFEICWTGVLGVLWLAAGAQQSQLVAGVTLNCADEGNSILQSLCNQFSAAEAFSFLNWLVLWSWMIHLIVFSAIAHSRGNARVWFSPAGTTNYFQRSNMPQQQPQPAYGMQPQMSGQQGMPPHMMAGQPGMQYAAQPQYGQPQQFDPQQQYGQPQQFAPQQQQYAQPQQQMGYAPQQGSGFVAPQTTGSPQPYQGAAMV